MVSDRYPRRDGGRRQTLTQSNGGQHHDTTENEPSVQSAEGRVVATSRRSTRSRRDDHDLSECSPPNENAHAVHPRHSGRSYTPPALNGVSPRQEPISVRRSSRRGNHVDDEVGAKQNVKETDSPKDRYEERRTTRRSQRGDIQEGEEEHRRSSRQRKSVYSSYNEVNITTPYTWRRGRRKDTDSPRADQEHDEEEGNMETMDMYTRVKRQRRKIKRDMYGMPLLDQEEEKSTEDEETEEEEGDEEEEEEEEGDEGEEATGGQYNLRQNKPRTKLYEAPPVERKSRHNYFKETPPKRKYKERSEIKFKSPAHRHREKSRRRRRRAQHRTSSTSSSSSGSESEDERRFARRKSKSMAKARQRCLPMNLAQNELTHVMKDRQKIGASLADIDPMSLDRSITFDSVGGLTEHIQALKEMIVFPLLYPEVFERFKIAPPRGVLFHGPPGTGKTLVARALANECSTGEKKVSFFMRKGADCLSKWVGESERQLRLLFDQAYQVRPSIIFFDEIDGLAPVRSSRQDQIHSSIVSTLLALMDGLDSRGEVVVIGATNRIDSIDPALRRPGRFDREFLFNLPPVEARSEILKIQTKEWNPKLLDSFIHEVASKCNGYCGADMKALCTEAALHALRRRYPQIYTSNDKLQLDVTSIDINAGDFHYAMSKIVPAGQRAVSSPGRPLSVIIQPLLKRQLKLLSNLLSSTFPYLPDISKSAQSQSTSSSMMASLLDAVDDDSNSAPVVEWTKSTKRKSKQAQADFTGPFLIFNISAYSRPIVSRPRLLLYGDPAYGHSTHLAPALLHSLEKLPVHLLDLPTLYANSARTPEESCSQVFREARRSTPSVIYIPHIDSWWQVLSDTMRATFLMMLSDQDPLMSILLLATADKPATLLPLEIRHLFSLHTSEQYQVTKPQTPEIREFFEDLIMKQSCVPPPTRKQAARNLLEVLPKANVTNKAAELTEVEEKSLWKQEEAVLRELRLFLRDMLNKLARDRKFNIFAKPVDNEEVPDYYEIIKAPMDLLTMMSKIDLHKYQTCKEFLDDIDLICANALEYNPADSIAGRAIRHRACALKDMAHALIEAELDEEFEKQCNDILESRQNRGKSPSKSAPNYYHTKPADGKGSASGLPVRFSRRLRHEDAEESLLALETKQLLDQAQPFSDALKEISRPVRHNRVSHDITQDDHPSPLKKKRRKRSRWSQGEVPSKRRQQPPSMNEDMQSEEEEEAEIENEPTEDKLHTQEHRENQSQPELPAEELSPKESPVDKSPAEESLTKELPVGDVNLAKLDLTDKFASCVDKTTDTEPATNGANECVAEDSVEEMDDKPGVTGSHEKQNGDCELSQAPGTNQKDSAYASLSQHDNDKNADRIHTQTADLMDTEETEDEKTSDCQESQNITDTNQTAPVNTHNGNTVECTSQENGTDSSAMNSEINTAGPKFETLTSPEKRLGSKSADVPQSPYIHEKVLEIEPNSTKRKTRSMTQDPHLAKCIEIIEAPLPAFYIDTDKLPALLDKAVNVGCLCNLTELEKLYSLIAQKIYHHRTAYNRSTMLQEIEDVLDGFNQ